MKKTLLLLVILIAASFVARAQCILFSDNFESGIYAAHWTNGTGSYNYNIVSASPAEGTYNLQLVSLASNSFYQGANGAFTASQPSYVSWWVRTSSTTVANAYFVLGDSDISTNNGILFCYISSSGNLRFFASSGYDYPALPNTWYHVEARNINWISRTMDLYINGSQVQSNWPFRSTTTTAVNQVHLFSLNPATSEYDDIIIGSTPLVISPSQTNADCYGDSTGSATVSVSGGTGSFQYLWSPTGDTTTTVSALTAGTYQCTVTDQNGCTATQSFTISESPLIQTMIDTSICPGSVFSVGVHQYSATGIYSDTLISSTSCDSIVNTDLTVETAPDVTTQLIMNVITANQSGAQYQWLDCDLAYAILPGETGQSLTVVAEGNYAVEVNLGQCPDTSTCVNVTFTGMEAQEKGHISIFPNPGNGLYLLNGLPGDCILSVYDLTGSLIVTAEPEGAVFLLDLVHLTSGMYTLKVEGTAFESYYKIVKTNNGK
jgi:hypothetical protein